MKIVSPAWAQGRRRPRSLVSPATPAAAAAAQSIDGGLRAQESSRAAPLKVLFGMYPALATVAADSRLDRII